jgi:hypothetical protein
MAIKTDNPAGRMFHLLTKAKASGEGSGYDIWSKVFDIQQRSDVLLDSSQFEVIHGLAQLRKVLDEIEDGMRSAEGLDLEIDHYIYPLERIRALLLPTDMSVSNYQTYLQEITPADMTVLALCAMELSKRSAEREANEDELSNLLDDITALYEEILKSSIHKQLKTLILEQLENIRRAIEEYRIGGIRRLRKALGESIGRLYLDKDLIESASVSDKEEVSKFWKIFIRFAAVTTFAADSTAVLTGLGPILPRLLT